MSASVTGVGSWFFFGKFDLTKAFPQLRRDELQAQGGVDVLLLRNRFEPDVQARLVKPHLFLRCQFAQLRDMLLRAGREHQGDTQAAFIR